MAPFKRVSEEEVQRANRLQRETGGDVKLTSATIRYGVVKRESRLQRVFFTSGAFVIAIALGYWPPEAQQA
jgi:hypothetical protein